MKNIARLVRTIKQCGYSVTFKKCEHYHYMADGWCDPIDKKIEIQFDKRASVQLITIILCHEMAHMWADMYQTGLGCRSVANEILAWDGAIELLQEIGFKNWKVYTRLRSLCLLSYGVNNRIMRWRLLR
jgi:hypothetical protein